MKKHIIILISVIIAIMWLFYLHNQKTRRNKTIAGEPDVVIGVTKYDLQMNQAIAKAKSEFKFFLENYKTMNNDGYSLKFAIPTKNGEIEHIWFNPLEINGDKIKAKCANDPENVPDLKFQDIRDLNLDQLSDWMIIVGKKCYGGYTIRILQERGKTKSPFEFVDIKELPNK